MISKHNNKNWEEMGARMPYFGVIPADEFRPASFDQAAREAFFASGEEHVARVMDWAYHHFGTEFSPSRCLDFGCGVGRLVIPLAKRSAEVVGVDVSTGMLEEARRNCELQGLDNVRFVVSDDDLSKVEGTFDLIHSFIVMQHIAAKRGERIFRKMLTMFNPNGIGFVHFTYGRENSKATEKAVKVLRENVPLVQGFINIAKGRDFGYPYVAMNAYDINKLVAILQQNGFDRLVLAFTNHGGDLGVALMFQNGRRDDPTSFRED